MGMAISVFLRWFNITFRISSWCMYVIRVVSCGYNYALCHPRKVNILTLTQSQTSFRCSLHYSPFLEPDDRCEPLALWCNMQRQVSFRALVPSNQLWWITGTATVCVWLWTYCSRRRRQVKDWLCRTQKELVIPLAWLWKGCLVSVGGVRYFL